MDLTGLNFNWQLGYFWKMNWNEQTQTVQHGAGQPLAYGIFERGLAGPWFVSCGGIILPIYAFVPQVVTAYFFFLASFAPWLVVTEHSFFSTAPTRRPFLLVTEQSIPSRSMASQLLVMSHSCDSTLRPRFIRWFVVTEHPSWTVEIPSRFCVMVCCDRAPMLLISPHYILCNRASVFRSLPHVTWRPSYSFVTGVLHCSRAPYPLVSCERALFSCSRRTKNESVKHCLTMPAVLRGNERLLAETAFV